MQNSKMTVMVNNNNSQSQKSEKTNEKKEPTYKDFVKFWRTDFTNKVKFQTNSRKQDFTFFDAIKSNQNRTKLDNVMIEYITYINSNPLNDNDYFKYFNSYINGKKLNEKYFRHDLEELHRYYKKYDDKTEDEKKQYNKFSVPVWERYVLFMMLKFHNLYENNESPFNFDTIFNVKINGSREYNPLTNVERALRGMLPDSLKLTEYDISRANPTFIDLELNIDRQEDIYSKFDKIKFNTLINLHNEDDPKKDIEKVRKQLKPLYNGRVNEVITKERFNNKGQMQRDLTRYEKEFIEKFIFQNHINTYVRLHDAIFVKSNTPIKHIEFDKVVRFNKTPLTPPTVLNDNVLFYSFDKKNNIITSPVSYKKFLEQENFIRVTEPNNDSITIFKDSNNVVKPFNYKTDTVSFLKSKINEFNTTEIENRIAKDNNKDIRDSFCLIDAKPLKYYRDKKKTFGIPFKNGFFQFNKDLSKIECIPYKEVDGFFPEHETQSKEFTPSQESDAISVFERFLTMVSISKDPIKDEISESESEIVSSFFQMFGYLIHTYKDPSFNPSVIFSDDGANNSFRNGGRGKTLVTKAISKLQKTIEKGNDEFDSSYRHKFADLDQSTKVYVLDDVKANFKYDDLYTNILGGISCELKGQTAKTIEFSETPKFAITTNWAVMYDKEATSTNRRFLEFKFTNYFNLNRTPETVFGHTFFTEWDSAEWNRFYNFSFACVKLFLEDGLSAPDYDKNLDNYNAYFYNESVEDEFVRLFELLNSSDGFKVNDFLNLYNSNDNPLRFEKYFHKNNAKKMIDVYIKYHNLEVFYKQRHKIWVSEKVEKTEF